MPRLPILTQANAVSEADWHDYIRYVYHQRIGPGESVDLNTFTWFYSWCAPMQRLLQQTPCLQVCQAALPDDVYDGSLWTGSIGPEALYQQNLGFFVSRASPQPQAVPSCTHLEVMHVHTTWNGDETGVSWMFHTVGSGVFLDCHNLPHSGSIVAYQNRASMGNYPDDSEGSPAMAQWMDDRGIAMLVITNANFWAVWSGGARCPNCGNPRTEIVVRQRQSGWGGVPESNEPHRSCLTDADYGFQFRTGIRATRPCVCQAADHVNCDGTSEG